MSRLVRVEIRRVLARRLTRVLLVLALGGIVAAGLVVFLKSANDAAAPPGIVHVTGDHKTVECPNGAVVEVPRDVGDDAALRSCGMFALSSADPRFHLTDLRDIWLVVGGQLIVVAWLLGASVVGAEWHFGTMTTFLTWEPRRGRVFSAKLVAVAVVVFVAVLVLLLLLGAALFPAAAFRGTTSGVDPAWVADALTALLRVGAGCAFGAALGYALATIGRNTAASLGAGFVYLVVVENLVRGLKPQWQGWLLGDNIVTFLAGTRDAVIAGRTAAEAAAIMCAYAVVPLAAAFLIFRRRDVT